MDLEAVEAAYWRHFVTDYSSHTSDRSANWCRLGIEIAVTHLLGRETFDAMYARFTERRIKALKAGELMPYCNLTELRRAAKQARKGSK
jgi:hypothetical protein